MIFYIDRTKILTLMKLQLIFFQYVHFCCIVYIIWELLCSAFKWLMYIPQRTRNTGQQIILELTIILLLYYLSLPLLPFIILQEYIDMYLLNLILYAANLYQQIWSSTIQKFRSSGWRYEGSNFMGILD